MTLVEAQQQTEVKKAAMFEQLGGLFYRLAKLARIGTEAIKKDAGVQ